MTQAPVRSAAVGRRVARRIAPAAVTNTIIGAVGPAVCFLVGRRAGGMAAALGLTAGWSCLWQAMRWLQRKPFSGLLALGLLELGLRMTFGLALHSARMFFLAPAVATAVTGVAYIGSGVMDRPLLTLVLRDLIPASNLDLSQLRVRKLVRTTSIVYGAEQVIVAALSILMVVTLSTSQYVTIHPLVSWSMFALVVVAGITMFRGEWVQLFREED